MDTSLTTKIRFIVTFWIAALVVLVIVFWVWRRLTLKVHAQQVDSAQLLLAPPSVSASVGDSFTVGLGLDTASTVIGVDAVFMFNSSQLDVVGATLGTSQLSTLVPGDQNVLDLGRAVTINTTDPSQSTLELGLVAFDQESGQPTAGVSGRFDPVTAALVTVNFRAREAGQGTIRLNVTPGSSTDTNVVALMNGEPVDIVTGPSTDVAVTVAPACQLPYDFNGDRRVDVSDVMQVAFRWNARVGDGRYDASVDTDSDGDIDVVDIQRVAGSWGQSCPTL